MSQQKVRSLHTITSFTKDEIMALMQNAIKIKAESVAYKNALEQKNVLMLFEKPSLRTRVSLECGVSQMGGHAIFYPLSDGPLGKGKENIHDTAKTASRYVDVIAARLYSRKDFLDLAKFATVPVVNLLDDYGHPCQIFADLLTIVEKKDIARGIKLAYFGDGRNNVTYDLMRCCALLGFNMDVACPQSENFKPEEAVMTEVASLSAASGAKIRVFDDLNAAAEGADVIYTDTWMSYAVKPHEMDTRFASLKRFQVTESTMKQAKADAIFMHCLPATRGNEMTEEVIDGPQSVVFDQAENRLHVQKAIVLFLLNVKV